MQIIITAIISFLAVYGLFELLHKIFIIETHVKSNVRFKHKIIAVDDNSVDVEADIRAAAEDEEEVILLDYSKTSEMSDILSHIQNEFSYAEVMKEDDYLRFLNEKSKNHEYNS